MIHASHSTTSRCVQIRDIIRLGSHPWITAARQGSSMLSLLLWWTNYCTIKTVLKVGFLVSCWNGVKCSLLDTIFEQNLKKKKTSLNEWVLEGFETLHGSDIKDVEINCANKVYKHLQMVRYIGTWNSMPKSNYSLRVTVNICTFWHILCCALMLFSGFMDTWAA